MSVEDLVLSDGQAAAYRDFTSFIIDPEETVFVLEGFAGTGKSTLVKKLLADLTATLKTAQLISESDIEWDVQLTATTNKACEALQEIADQPVVTIQSFLGLRVKTDWKKQTTTLVAHGGAVVKKNTIIFIDEASFEDDLLLRYIDKFTENCKIIHIGDPAQLTPVGFDTAPVFAKGYRTAKLTEVLRQAEGNPIIDMVTMFREVVYGKPWGTIKLDPEHILHLSRDDYNQMILDEFSNMDWLPGTSKKVAWRNKTVLKYNHAIRDKVRGSPELQKGDYAVCNSHIGFKNGKIKTDQTVCITDIVQSRDEGEEGWDVRMDNKFSAFLPRDTEARKRLLAIAKAGGDTSLPVRIEKRWIDLRMQYCCTVNKSQGSTYDRVFIDLDDIGANWNKNQVARYLYVAASRARHQVIFTGSL